MLKHTKLALSVVAACGLAVSLEAALEVPAEGMAAAPAAAFEAVLGPHVGEVVPTRLYLRTGEVDTTRERRDLHAQIGKHAEGTRFVIQLDGPITPERRERLRAAGIGLGAYLPMFAYIATIDQADPRAVQGLEFIRWYDRYQNSWKLDPEIGARPYLAAERQALVAAGRDYLVVTVFPGADLNAVEQGLMNIVPAGHGVHQMRNVAAPERGPVILAVSQGMAEDLGGTTTDLYIEMNVADVDQLALIPGVQYVEPASDVDLRAARRNDQSRWTVQSNQVGVYPLYAQGLRGEGQIAAILDTAVRQDHCSFHDPNNPIGPNHRKIIAYNMPTGSASHGTHVAGTIVGDAGSETGHTRGIAYMARIATNHWGSSPFADIMARLDQHHSQGARIHSNSWGDDGTTAYNNLCRNIDLFQWQNEDSLTTWAVTNTSTLKNPENAKNTLAVGATMVAPSQHQHGYGGTGPTSDGRRKPEIYAPGRSTNSASSSSTCGVSSSGGTSMACPVITGTGLLIRQYFEEGFYPVGIRVPGAEFTPSAALIKAMLLNSAVDMTGVPGYPSNQEGWGRVLADNSVYFDGDPRKLNVVDIRNAEGMSTSEVIEYYVPVLGSQEQFRVTLSWIEPPGTAGTSFAHVNDLDLEVVAPDQSLYRGNVFNTTAGHSITGGSRDDRNNVEQVHINNPEPGLWTVRVRATAINQGLQGYALVKTGDIAPAEPPELIMVMGNPVPHMIEPNEPYELRVRIIEGSQQLVPGSGKMHYRSESTGSFTSVPLVQIDGDLYGASLPGFECGLAPEFYFSAEGDLGANVVFPHEAPLNILSTNVAVILNEPVLETTFETAWPAGWSATGIWHVTSACAPAGNTCAQGPHAYYGRSTTCNYNLPTGTNAGTLTAPQITLPQIPPTGGIVVKFCYALETEGHANFDRAELLVNGQTRPEWRIPDVTPTPGEPDLFWSTAEIDLTEFAGETITLGWRFNTVNSLNNHHRGWHVNNVRVLAQVAGCEPAPKCYANCDGSTNEPVLNVDDFTCFINSFAEALSLPPAQQVSHYANCDGSTNHPVLNVDDFTCFINLFAQGCP